MKKIWYEMYNGFGLSIKHSNKNVDFPFALVINSYEYPYIDVFQYSSSMTNSIIDDKRVLELKYRMPIGGISNFFKGLKSGKLLATRCDYCGTIYFPPQSHCTKCSSDHVSWIELSGRGTLETYTTIVVKPTSFADKEDYIIAVGKMEEGINVLATLRVSNDTNIRVGMKIVLVPLVEDDNASYEFHLTEEDGK
ncbi:MAG: Zn-ribbon domain-containing OB-fold protein [Thermoplasmatales archaeon]